MATNPAAKSNPDNDAGQQDTNISFAIKGQGCARQSEDILSFFYENKVLEQIEISSVRAEDLDTIHVIMMEPLAEERVEKFNELLKSKEQYKTFVFTKRAKEKEQAQFEEQQSFSGSEEFLSDEEEILLEIADNTNTGRRGMVMRKRS